MPALNSIDVAAGGLVESTGGGVLRLALVHRARYDDWTLPKGHLDEGETLEQAALREVLEETGCRGEITKIVQPVAYLVKGQPKIVIFYRMKLIEAGELTPNDEVSTVIWVTPKEALEQLTYASERRLVRETYVL